MKYNGGPIWIPKITAKRNQDYYLPQYSLEIIKARCLESPISFSRDNCRPNRVIRFEDEEEKGHGWLTEAEAYDGLACEFEKRAKNRADELLNKAHEARATAERLRKEENLT